MNRRTFLKLTGLGSISFAAGCSPESPKYLYSLVQAPEDMVTGKATWYASTCRECPAGCGIIARNREGRVVKVEGNPLHPLNRGKLCMRGQAALQAVYNPDRLKTPLLKEKDGFVPIGFDRAQALLKTKVWEAARRGPERVRLMTEVVGEGQMEIFRSALKNWNSPPPVVFEPFAYEALKAANREVFGVDGLVSYRLDQADVLLAFGAEFLETWLSPVEYAWKFKAMHAARGARKGLLFPGEPVSDAHRRQRGPLARLRAGHRGGGRPGPGAPDAGHPARSAPAAGPARGLAKGHRGLPAGGGAQALRHPAGASTSNWWCAWPKPAGPWCWAPAAGSRMPTVLPTNLAANLLNLLLDPELRLIDAANRHRVETASRRSDVLDLFKAVSSGRTDVLILNNVNPVFSLPPESGAKAALETPDLFVVSLSNFLDETSQRADLILPVSLPLETWDDYSGWSSLVSTLQPAMGRITEAPHLGDLFPGGRF